MRPSRPTGLFVTGTDTEVGKTVVACAISSMLAARGARVSVFKPVVTGLDETGPGEADHERLRAAARSTQTVADVSPYRFGPPVSPHLAAELAGTAVDPATLRRAARATAKAGHVLVAEGVGGLLVPLAGDYLVRDFAVDLGLPVVIAARPGLGTISHTLLTIESARTAGLEVAAVVLTPWPERPSLVERSNRDTIAQLGRVDVATLTWIETSVGGPSAAPDLPLDRWLEPARIRAGAA